nr:separase isoform X2 [Tanacetum cinerariifolium]
KFYTKQHKWDLAVKKIYEAEPIWIDVKSGIFCLECNTIFEISIKHAYGDVWLESKSNTPKGMNVTLSFHQYAEEKLNSSMWENNFSCPNEAVKDHRNQVIEIRNLYAKGIHSKKYLNSITRQESVTELEEIIGTRKKDPIFMRKLVRGLKISFSLSRQVPTLHREVSRLLAILYYVDKEPTDGNGPSAQQWAAYFHQSSIGTYFNNSLIARLGNIQGQNPILDASIS